MGDAAAGKVVAAVAEAEAELGAVGGAEYRAAAELEEGARVERHVSLAVPHGVHPAARVRGVGRHVVQQAGRHVAQRVLARDGDHARRAGRRLRVGRGQVGPQAAAEVQHSEGSGVPDHGGRGEQVTRVFREHAGGAVGAVGGDLAYAAGAAPAQAEGAELAAGAPRYWRRTRRPGAGRRGRGR